MNISLCMRACSNFMRQQAMASKMVFNRPVPVNRLVSTIADSTSSPSHSPRVSPSRGGREVHLLAADAHISPLEAQVNTQEYGRRPYGVGFLVVGLDHTGPHLYEFSPSGTSFEYFAVSIGARSQSAKTYLEKHFESFADCTVSVLFSLFRYQLAHECSHACL